MEKEISFKVLLEKLDKGEFNCSRSSMAQAGWYDWFCNDNELFDRLYKLVDTLRKVATSPKIDTTKTYVFFKNNCPITGPLYDSFSICNLKDGEVLLWLGKLNRGCYGENFSGWELRDYTSEKCVLIRGLKEIKKHLGIK